jgi:putative membrane protein (TIGR04086 family)
LLNKDYKYMGEESFMKIALKGLLIAFMITIPTFFVIAIFLTFSEMPEKYIDMAVAATTFVSIPLGAFAATRGAKKSGTVSGAMIGALYMVILYILTGIIKKDFSIPLSVIRMVLISITLGAIGGLAGVNMRRKSKKKTRVEPRRYY